MDLKAKITVNIDIIMVSLLEEMIVYSAPKAAEAISMSKEEARKMCEGMFPKLKR